MPQRRRWPEWLPHTTKAAAPDTQPPSTADMSQLKGQQSMKTVTQPAVNLPDPQAATPYFLHRAEFDAEVEAEVTARRSLAA